MVMPLDLVFPGLQSVAYQVTSPKSRVYNCIAWAAGDTTTWWWPNIDPDDDAIYWPPGVPCEETLTALSAAFGILGYIHSTDESFEPGFEKVALFASSDDRPTHAARQLSNGL